MEPSPNSKAYLSGFSLIESMLAISVFLIVVVGLGGSLIYSKGLVSSAGERARATYLAEEGLEALRNIRDENFSNLINGTHGLAVSGGQWTLSGASDSLDIFTRTVAIGTIDARTKQATSTVTWTQGTGQAGSVTLVTRLTDWKQLIATVGSWTSPTQDASYNAAGTELGAKVATKGTYAYLVRTDGTPDFLVLDISNTSAPTLVGSLSLTGTPVSIAVCGDYAYVTNTDNASELQIINIATPSAPSLTSTLNLTGNTDAAAVAVQGSSAYVTRLNSADPEFYVVSVTNPASPSITGSLNLNGSATDITLLGNYAYIASTDNGQELQVVDLTTPSSPTLLGSANLTGNADGLSIAGFGTTVIVGRATGGNTILLSVATPASPSVLGTYSGITGNVTDLALGNANTFLWAASSDTAGELEIINISTPASPTLVGSFNAAGSYTGVAYYSRADRAVVSTAITSGEFALIRP